jgi:Spondin_N
MPKRFPAVLSLLAAAAIALVFAAPAMGRSYDVTITDLTGDPNTGGGQPLTPPVLATHTGKNAIFTVGQPASVGVREIAENGNLDPLLAQLEADPFNQISEVVHGDVPLVPAMNPGSANPAAVTIPIDGSNNARRLSWVSMLICTNDGLTGVNSLRLPGAVGETTTKTTAGYDAHTERNTEDYADIVPPCQGLIGPISPIGEMGTTFSNPMLAEGGVISHHDGIDAGGVGEDLTQSRHGWTDPVARIVVERTD